ncbi:MULTISPECIES: cation diffusion facilitator family transporter [unclassified Paenibacillus]|uniref:cation diffusion facilitator family transporter n=1 Tax=unclassified Paenibacillus TaxID=185978 RepID=UPI0027832455|nr:MULTISPECIES: cation diffusion facilitator family transporter [unclassified Paenibacillus]MDQ0902468.1 cation diffusion facilitator family transporter [Paenibacillus sp. V4I7]MDQ0919020.1 cation diffusion facilitator family transporter [Paenibacillus sp. V4I5]
MNKTASMLAIWISLASNIVLTAIKIIVGLNFKSQVLIADGIHNAGDVIATATAYSSMRVSSKPADVDHPYGHGKAEVLGAFIVAIILGGAAIYMGYHSIHALFEPAGEAHIIAFIAAIISLVWKQILYVYTKRIGNRVNSKGLIATAYDHLADVYASIAASIGIGLALIGDHYDYNILAYGDPVAGIIVSFLVLKLAYEMGSESFDILMERSVSTAYIEQYAALIRTVPEVKRIDRLRAREHGHYILVDARLAVSGELTIQEGHDISRLIKQKIKEAHSDVDEVLVHLNPWYEESTKSGSD